MPIYLLHGFRWPREGFTGIRVHAIVHNLEDCSVEYIQNEHSKQDILESFRKGFPDVMQKLETNGAHLDFIEQHDPEDITGPNAVSQPHAFVADKVVEMAGQTDTAAVLSVNVEDVVAAGSGVPSQVWEALADLRDKIAAGEKIGWWVVYNGDPERAYDSEYDDDDDDEDNASTPTQATAEDIGSQAQGQAPAQLESRPQSASTSQPTSASATKSMRSAFTLPTRSKAGSKKTEASTEGKLPDPKQEQLPEPPKLKEVAQKTGFRKKFFGKKA